MVAWWRRHEQPAIDAKREARNALLEAKAQRPEVQRVDDFVTRVARTIGRQQ